MPDLGHLAVLRDEVVRVDGVDVAVRIVCDLRDPVDRGCVTVRAPAPGSRSLEVRARPGAYLIAAGRQDAITGHAAFDRRYIVKTNDVALMRRTLGTVELEAILATFDPDAHAPFTFELANGVVTLTASGDSPITSMQRDAARIGKIDEAIRAAAIISNRASGTSRDQ